MFNFNIPVVRGFDTNNKDSDITLVMQVEAEIKKQSGIHFTKLREVGRSYGSVKSLSDIPVEEKQSID